MTRVVQWFPGHMAKAKREAEANIKQVDIALELIDARIPEASRSPIIDEIIGDKRRIIVLNKMDLAENDKTNEWLDYYKEKGYHAVAIDSQHQKGINTLTKKCQDLMEDFFQKQEEKGLKRRPIRLMILGIPNVGKSTLINRFVGKNQAITGNKPGVTRKQRWLKIRREFELLDTPGILWHKIDDQEVAKLLSLTGAITDKILHMDDLALDLIERLRKLAPDRLERYKITEEDLLNKSNVDILYDITSYMGFIDDYDRASERLINDYRANRLGSLTLQRVQEVLDD